MTYHQHLTHFQQPEIMGVLSFNLLASVALNPIPSSRSSRVKYKNVIPYNTLNYIQFYVTSVCCRCPTRFVFSLAAFAKIPRARSRRTL